MRVQGVGITLDKYGKKQKPEIQRKNLHHQ